MASVLISFGHVSVEFARYARRNVVCLGSCENSWSDSCEDTEFRVAFSPCVFSAQQLVLHSAGSSRSNNLFVFPFFLGLHVAAIVRSLQSIGN